MVFNQRKDQRLVKQRRQRVAALEDSNKALESYMQACLEFADKLSDARMKELETGKTDQ